MCLEGSLVSFRLGAPTILDNRRSARDSGSNPTEDSNSKVRAPKACVGDIHCVAVGDANSGKNNLLAAYEKIDSSERTSNFCIEYNTHKVLGDFAYKFVFSGFSGQEQRHNLRRLSYLRPTGVFLVCFSVVDEMQFANAVTDWVSEIQENAPDAPYILVGTHSDLRSDRALRRKLELDGRRIVTRRAAEGAARLLGCKYLECSSRTKIGVQKVFETAIQAALKGPVAEECRKMCMLM